MRWNNNSVCCWETPRSCIQQTPQCDSSTITIRTTHCIATCFKITKFPSMFALQGLEVCFELHTRPSYECFEGKRLAVGIYEEQRCKEVVLMVFWVVQRASQTPCFFLCAENNILFFFCWHFDTRIRSREQFWIKMSRVSTTDWCKLHNAAKYSKAVSLVVTHSQQILWSHWLHSW